VKKPGLVVAVLVVLAVMLALATQFRSPHPKAATVVPAVTTAPTAAPSVPEPSPSRAGAVVTTDEPGLYAAKVAAVVFGMDTRSLTAADYRAMLLAEADPNLTETGRADLVRLVDGRIPADDLWQRMRGNAQWSTFVVTSTWEPGSWQQVVTSGQAEPGWAMRNVTGTQITHYVEDGTAREAERERTLTVGMRCPAADAGVDRCRLVLLGASVVP
jgi:hypothetical protein